MGIGRYIGGALTGIGQGMAMKAQDDFREAALARRDAALAAIRQQEIASQGEQTRWTQAEGNQQEHASKTTLQSNQQAWAAQQGRAAAEAAARAQESEQQFKERMARLESGLRTNEAIAEINARARNENQQVFDIKTDEVTGANFAVLRDGTEVPLKKTIARKQPRASDGNSLFAGPAGGTPSGDSALSEPDYIYDAKTGGIIPNPNKSR